MRRKGRAVVALLGAFLLAAPATVSATTGDLTVQATAHWWANVEGSSRAGAHKAVDIRDASGADGAIAQLWVYNGTANQKFYHDSAGSGLIRLRNVNSGKCLDLKGPSDANGTQVHQWNCNNSDSQKWRRVKVGEQRYIEVDKKWRDVYKFVNQYGRDTCLDNEEGSGNNGNKIQIWTCNGRDTQLWY